MPNREAERLAVAASLGITEWPAVREEATPRPWRVRVDDSFPNRSRIVIEGDYPADATSPFLSYVVAADDMDVRRDRAQADYDLIVRAVNEFDSTRTQLAAMREALRVAADEIEHLYAFAIAHGIPEAATPPHVAARAALKEEE